MLRNENGRVTCTTELSVDLDGKKWKMMRAMTWIKEVLREDCAVEVSRSKQLQWEQSLVSFDWIKGFR